MRLRSILGGLGATLALTTAAQAATLVTIHAEGTATGHLVSLGVVYPNPEPITVHATFDLSKGTRLTTAMVDRIDGAGANSPGSANVAVESFHMLAETGWGDQYASLSFFDTFMSSTLQFTLLDPTSSRAMYLVVNRPGKEFVSLDSVPTGEICVGANTCAGGIVDPNGGTVGNDLALAWSSVTLTVTDTAVPEPATWALMIVGFGGAGAALRRSRRHAEVMS